MQRSLDTLVREALGRLRLPYLYNDRTDTFTVSVPIEGRGMTLIGVHCHEAERYIWVESTIFLVPDGQEVRCRARLLETSIKFVHLSLIDRIVHVEMDLDLTDVVDPVRVFTRNFARFTTAIELLYPQLLTSRRPTARRSKSWVVNEIRTLLDQIEQSADD